MKTLTIMDQAILTGRSTVISSVSLRLKVNESLSVLAGGLLQCKWLEVVAKTITVESSGSISAVGFGSPPKHGSGSTSGTICF